MTRYLVPNILIGLLVMSPVGVNAQDVSKTQDGAEGEVLTEADWQEAYRKAERDRSGAGRMKELGRIAFVGGLFAMAVASRTGSEEDGGFSLFTVSSVTCRVDPPNYQSTCTETPVDTDTRSGASKAIVIPGLIAMGSGLVFALIGRQKAGAAAEEIERLDDIGKERGWGLSVAPEPGGIALGLGYEW